MKFRVVSETEVSGITNYYVQRTFLGIFWAYFSEPRDITMWKYKVVYKSFNEARSAIIDFKKTLSDKQRKKIIKKEYLKI